jgi:environmental stress-induced protein Ves
MSSIQHLLATDRPAVPWKNGQGRTWQVAAHPEGADVSHFDWRISIAEISQDGAFSAFPGVDRTIAVIDGAGVELHSSTSSGSTHCWFRTRSLFGAMVQSSRSSGSGRIRNGIVRTLAGLSVVR